MPQSVKTVLLWALGVGIIALSLLILLILFGNLQGNLGFTQDSETFANYTIVLTNDTTGENVTKTGRTNAALTNLVVVNKSGFSIPAINYTSVGVVIYPSGASTFNGTEINVSGTVSYDTQQQMDVDHLILNYSASAVNTSKQFPVVGTILGIAVLLAILIMVLTFAIQKLMGVTESTGIGNSMGGAGGSSGGGSGGSSGGGSSKFKGSGSAGLG